MTEFARENRKNLTPEELKIWLYCLRDFPVRVHRQKVIGRYIADFYIAKYKTVIEIDGSQHYEKEGLEYDAERTAYFESLGMKVLRYTNREINRDFNSVCEDIKQKLGIYRSTTSVKRLRGSRLPAPPYRWRRNKIAPPVWRGARDRRFAGVVMTRRRDARPEVRGGGEETD